MSAIGVILARGSSKRLPRKNVRPLLGTPLVAWMTRAALASRLDRVAVSTEDNEIADIVKHYGGDAPFRRPDELANDYASSDAILRHALETIEQQEGKRYDVVVTLQPTTPFVRPEDIDGCLDALDRNAAVMSCFTARKASEPPAWLFRERADGTVAPYEEGPISGEREHSQLLREALFPTGAAYAQRVTALYAQQRVICDPAMIQRMPPERSVDVDDELDWVTAEAVGRHFGFRPYEAKER